MTLPRTPADVLSGHVSFEVECVDRMYLNVYVPQLQYATGLVSYIHRQLGMPVASTAALAPVSASFTMSVRSFAAGCGIPWVDFAKGQRKDDVAQKFLAGFAGTEGVLFIGRAQEKVSLFRTSKRRRADGSSYPWIAAETGVVNWRATPGRRAALLREPRLIDHQHPRATRAQAGAVVAQAPTT